jgi:hypothetical protein
MSHWLSILMVNLASARSGVHSTLEYQEAVCSQMQRYIIVLLENP